MSKTTTPAPPSNQQRPRAGGSYVRQTSGSLKRTAHTRPSNGPALDAIGAEIKPEPEAAPKPQPEPQSAPAKPGKEK